MNKIIKLLALDIDGTLMGRDYILQEPVIEAIKRVKIQTDIKVVLASGRMTHSTIPIAEQLHIDTPLVVYQGAMINDFKNNKLLLHKTVDPHFAEQIIKDIENEDIHVNLYINDKLYMKQLSEIADVYSSSRYVKPILIDDYSLIYNTPPTKILGLDNDKEKIKRLTSELGEKYKGKLNIFGSSPRFIEVVNPEVNKGQTLVNMAKDLWDIDPVNIMAIGDADNDYDMLQLVGYSVAMGNATEKAKSVAKFVTLPATELGVVFAIEKIIFEGVKI